ncbi:MAG: hypothetical protein JW861_14245 [Bacteroidales bacterium]|nr:hypothetical protein [Bacteroidales bacterium]
MKRILVAGMAVILPALSAPCQDVVEIPVQCIRNATLVTVKIGDVSIPDIMLDTGLPYDGILIYNPGYSDSLDLSRAMQVRLGGAGDGEASHALMIDSTEFSLGHVNLVNQRIILLQGDAYKGFPTNGVLGYSIFGHYAVELDYDRQIMTLRHYGKMDPDSSWTEVPLFFRDNNIPWMEAFVAVEDEPPVPLSMYIDFADRDAIVLLEKPGMKFKLPEETEEVFLGRGLSGDIYGKKGPISRLIIGDHELKQVNASFAPAEVRSRQRGADAVMGSGILTRFNLIFDYSNRKLYIKPNSRFDDPF